MYVVVQHRFNDPQTALSRGATLIKNDGAPPGVRGLQFYPSRDQSSATCLWEADSVQDIQHYVDSTLGGLQREHVLRSRRRTGICRAAVGAPAKGNASHSDRRVRYSG